MPDILLIQPPIKDFYLTAKRTIPYGLACIAAKLIKDGFSVEILDALAAKKSRVIELPCEMTYLKTFYAKPDISPFALFHHFRHFGYSFEHIGKTAVESGAFLVGISSLFTAYSDEALETARIVKKFHPGCHIVIGGHHPTSLPEEVMKCEAVDFAVRGEGEASLPMLANALKNGEKLDNIPGIVFRRPDKSLHISEPAIMENLDDYPLPDMNLIKHQFYKRNQRGSTVIISSRGCPMKCSYCSVGASGLKYRRRCVDSVLKEIENAVTMYDAGFIDFEDENLSLEKKWFLELLQKIKTRFGSYGLELRAMNGLFSPSLDEELINAMKEAGFKTLNLSLGTTSANQLKKFKRPDVRASLENAIDLGKKYGLEAVCYIIAGAPGQQAEDSVKDLLWIRSKKVLAGVSIYYPAPGSADYALAEKSGLLPPHFSLMRSSALPLSHTTTRTESVTLLRLGRILNFMKSLEDRGEKIPAPAAFAENEKIDPHDRDDAGKKLLAWFLYDGKIRGISPEGDIFLHNISMRVSEMLIKELNL